MNLKFQPAKSISVPASYEEALQMNRTLHTATPRELDLAAHIAKGKLWLTLDDTNNPSYYDNNDYTYWCIEVPVPKPFSNNEYHRRGWFRSVSSPLFEEQNAKAVADLDGGCFDNLADAVIQTQADLLIQELLLESNTCEMCWGSGVSEFEEIVCPLCGGGGFIKLCALN